MDFRNLAISNEFTDTIVEGLIIAKALPKMPWLESLHSNPPPCYTISMAKVITREVTISCFADFVCNDSQNISMGPRTVKSVLFITQEVVSIKVIKNIRKYFFRQQSNNFTKIRDNCSLRSRGILSRHVTFIKSKLLNCHLLWNFAANVS